jgi:hypothetical protein
MIDDVNSRVPAPGVHVEVRHRSESGNGRKKKVISVPVQFQNYGRHPYLP